MLITREDIEKELKQFNEPINDEQNLGEFPINSFHPDLKEIISEFHRFSGLPVDYFALSILCISGGLIGNSYKLQLKPGEEYNSILFGAIVGPSGIGKSPALNLCLKPVFEIEKQYQNEYENELNFNESESAKRKEIAINDITTEGLIKSLSDNPKGVILYLDEILQWINSFNRYRKGPDEQIFLSLWSGSFIKVTRKTQGVLSINNPALSAIGGIQPGMLSALSKGDKKENGFLFRILFAYPHNLQKPKKDDKDLDESINDIYCELINSLHQIPYNENPDLIDCENEAKEIYYKWYNKQTDLYNDLPEGYERTILSKMQVYALRISIVLHIQNQILNREEIGNKIQKHTIESAINIAEYFTESANRVLQRIENYNPLDDLDEKRLQIYNELPSDGFITAHGVLIAEKIGMHERTFKGWLRDKRFFKKKSHGNYLKVI